MPPPLLVEYIGILFLVFFTQASSIRAAQPTTADNLKFYRVRYFIRFTGGPKQLWSVKDCKGFLASNYINGRNPLNATAYKSHAAAV